MPRCRWLGLRGHCRPLEKPPGGDRQGPDLCTAISRSGQEVLVHPQGDGQVVHIPNIGARRRSTCRPSRTDQVIIRRQEGRSVCRFQDIAGQRRCIQMLLQEVHANIERLGEVVLQAAAN